ncbi:MAG: 4'-phosphopantetheinyl transferase superfamily protein [Bacteroidia bacterium]|nr:4'-phosphopantetheinyl transferase superfamily protein [Bacteroidia bacterium]
MPLVIQKNISANCFLAVWHITESIEEMRLNLGENLIEKDKEKKLVQANARHYLASRILLTNLFPAQTIELLKNQNNKPSLFLNQQEWSISITHSFDYAAILIQENGHLGIDIERIDPRITRVKQKFMNEAEKEFAGAENQIAEQVLIWSAKETLYKVYGNKELDFKNNLYIEPFVLAQQGSIQTRISKEDFTQNCEVNFFQVDNYYLTYSIQTNS